MRDRTEQAELDFDTKGERFNVITDKPIKSLFLDDVEDDGLLRAEDLLADFDKWVEEKNNG